MGFPLLLKWHVNHKMAEYAKAKSGKLKLKGESSSKTMKK